MVCPKRNVFSPRSITTHSWASSFPDSSSISIIRAFCPQSLAICPCSPQVKHFPFASLSSLSSSVIILAFFCTPSVQSRFACPFFLHLKQPLRNCRHSCLLCPAIPQKKHFVLFFVRSISIGCPEPPYVIPPDGFCPVDREGGGARPSAYPRYSR